MGFLDRLRGGASAHQRSGSRTDSEAELDSDITVYLVEDTHSFDGDTGETIWCCGLSPVAQDGHFLLESEHRTSDPRVYFCKVAGARHYPEALRDDRIGPGSAIVLKAEPDNPYDENAVGVWGILSGDHVGQLGHIPATLSPEIAAMLRTGKQLGGQVIREFRRGSSHGERIGWHILIAPAGERVSLVIEDEDAP